MLFSQKNKMNKYYYNTTGQTGQTLIDFSGKAKSQEEMVYEIFKSNPNRGFSWNEVKQAIGDINECSLKRCITNLKNAFKVEKTNEMVMTTAGRQAHRYKLI